MSDEKYLATREASEFLHGMGLPLAPATLKKKRCVGGGPIFQIFGRTPVYTEPRLREFALSQLSAELSSSSSEAQVVELAPPPAPRSARSGVSTTRRRRA